MAVRTLDARSMMLLRNRNGSTIGVLKGETLTKKVYSSVHKLRIVDGYGIDQYAFDLAFQNGAREIVIKEVDTGRVLRADMEYFKEKAIEVDFGYGKQLALAGDYWELVTGQEKLL